MNWESLRKNLNRAGTSLMQKTGIVEKTVDVEYEEQEGRLRALGGRVETLHREAKACLDSLRAVASGQERIAESLCSMLDDASAPTTASRQARMYKDVMDLLSAHGRQEIDESFRATVLEPLTRFAIAFPECEDLAKRRTARLLDYDAARAKLEAEEQHVKAAYDEINGLLVTGIPMLIDTRTPYLEPSMEAALKLQKKWADDVARQLEALSTTRTSEAEIDSVLRELRALPILNM